jgi:hypothetical protein
MPWWAAPCAHKRPGYRWLSSLRERQGVEALFKGCTDPPKAFGVISPLARLTAPKTAEPDRCASG